MLTIVLLAFAFVCFCIAAYFRQQPLWNLMIGLGLAFLTASLLFGEAIKNMSGH